MTEKGELIKGENIEIRSTRTKKVFLESVRQELIQTNKFDEKKLKDLLLCISRFHESLKPSCTRIYQDIAVNMEAIFKEELEQIIFQGLIKKYKEVSTEKLRTILVLINWMIYGASVDWKQNSNVSSEEYVETLTISIRHILTNEIFLLIIF